MCGRYNLHQTYLLKERYNTVNQVSIFPDYNRSPGTINPVIVSKFQENWLLGFEWGIHKENYLISNKRIESIQNINVFYSKCLVPINGYYEWKSTPSGKIPFYIHPETEQLLSLAGVYKKDNSTGICRYAILTKPATPQLEFIHSRMPVLIDKDSESLWLNESDQIEFVLSKVNMNLFPVSNKMNNPKFSDPICIEKSEEYQIFFL